VDSRPEEAAGGDENLFAEIAKEYRPPHSGGFAPVNPSRAEVMRRIEAVGIRPGTSPRMPVVTSARSRTEIVDQFAEYAAEYRANVVRVNFADLDDAVRGLLLDRGHTSIVVPEDFPAIWLTGDLVIVRDSDSIPHRGLSDMHAVVTGCAVAIAETGTIVLDAGFAQGRRAITLVPDHHVCVVFEDQVVDSVPEAVSLLGESVRKGQPLTWISGPSATSDIELSRVEGVHGPRTLDVVLVSR